MPKLNRGIALRRYPDGVPRTDDFAFIEAPAREPGDGEVLVETQYLSMDPAPRLRMNDAAKFPPPLPLGEIVIGRGVGVVRGSRCAGVEVGDIVAGDLGWQTYATVPGSAVRKVDAALGPVQSALGILGPSGITAWFLVHDAAIVRSGETVVVTAAAGSVGSTAVQLARISGARVVGIVGGTGQARFVKDDLGADAVVDYRSSDLAGDLAAACPTGANVVLDSVGGSLHNAIMMHIAEHARIVAFGYISAYNSAADQQPEYGRTYQLIRRRALLRGFLIGDYASRFREALAELSALLVAGRIRGFEQCSSGIESVPAAFAALFTGDPVGKQLVQLCD